MSLPNTVRSAAILAIVVLFSAVWVVHRLAVEGSVRGLQSIAIALAIAASGLLGWVLWLLAHDTRREKADTDMPSDRVRLEDELRASEARWRSVIDSAVDGIIVIDEHGRIEAFNPAAERLFGTRSATLSAATSLC